MQPLTGAWGTAQDDQEEEGNHGRIEVSLLRGVCVCVCKTQHLQYFSTLQALQAHLPLSTSSRHTLNQWTCVSFKKWVVTGNNCYHSASKYGLQWISCLTLVTCILSYLSISGQLSKSLIDFKPKTLSSVRRHMGLACMQEGWMGTYTSRWERSRGRNSESWIWWESLDQLPCPSSVGWQLVRDSTERPSAQTDAEVQCVA